MNTPIKLLLGLITIWPVIYTIFLLLALFQAFYLMIGYGSSEAFIFRWFDALFPVHVLTMLWIFVLMIFYMVTAVRNNRLKNEMKAVWAVAILMAGVFAMPIYWYLNIWREGKESPKR